MIQANELRIGNFVSKSLRSSNGRKLNSEIGCEDITRIHNYYNTSIFIYEPIPITKEWLLKFGFTLEDNNSYQLDTDFGFSIWGRIGHGFNVYANSDSIGNEKQYVHQLQNLYFSLTQTELEYVGTN